MAVLKGKILILRAMRYNMTDEKTGDVISGCKMSYIQDFETVEMQNKIGVDPLFSTMPYEFFEKVVTAPAWYDAKLNLSSDGKGKPTLTLLDIEYSSPMSLDPASK